LRGTDEMLAGGEVDLAIRSEAGAGAGLAGEPLMKMRGIAVAAPSHPLHQLGRTLTERDLKRHRRIFIRETGSQRTREVEGVELRWTVSNKATSIRAVSMGLGFSWMPVEWIAEELRTGALKPLPLKGGAEREAQLFLAFADPEFPGRDVERLADIIRARTRDACSKVRGRTKRSARSEVR
jgi:DNA-binding transcriptional LysR family regulator